MCERDTSKCRRGFCEHDLCKSCQCHCWKVRAREKERELPKDPSSIISAFARQISQSATIECAGPANEIKRTKSQPVPTNPVKKRKLLSRSSKTVANASLKEVFPDDDAFDDSREVHKTLTKAELLQTIGDYIDLAYDNVNDENGDSVLKDILRCKKIGVR